MAALDQAVNERNILSAQNTQLWKLIEKQRSGYNQILKELERIRGERDAYKSKIISLGGTIDTKRQKPADRANKSNTDPPRTPNGSLDASPNPRNLPHHIHSSRSYEPLFQRTDSLQSNASLGSSATPRTESPPPLPPPVSAPTATFPTFPTFPTTPSKSLRPSPSPLVVPPRSESLSLPVSASSTASDDHSASTLPYYATRPLQYRKGSITDSIMSGTNINVPPASSNLHNVSTNTPTQGNPTHSPTTPQTAPPVSSIQITMSPATPSPSNPQTQVQSNSLSSIPESHPLLPPIDPRSSRITLPDEARQYIVNMVDSPVSSPKADVFTSSKPRVSSNLAPQRQSESPNQNAEFLDFEDDEDDESGNEEDEDADADETDQEQTRSTESGAHESFGASANTSTSTLSEQQLHQQNPYAHLPMFTNPFPDTAQMAQGQPQERGQAGGVSSASSSDVATPVFDQTAGFGQIPLGTHQPLISTVSSTSAPQSHSQFQPQLQSESYSHTQPQAQQHLMPQGQQQQQPQSSLLTSEQMNFSSTSLLPYSSHPAAIVPPRVDSRPPEKQSQPQVGDTSTMSTTTSSTIASMESLPRRERDVKEQYRALPLLSSDLPTTSVTVSHSLVRPNEKGKEVLSFIIIVNPGTNHKEPWRVEKLYSDVVSLDARVRASVGKTIGKRIVTLPEGKLWRDHAPAKVDQRKAVLEAYLQSLVKLPVKNNDEVIAFLTSDIVRETRQPVMQAGHKEGYLTKRGKNFGGWKTRYFVLQGPVLEYYESRGGAHLGSIAVTGAQIGRQQRTERQSSHDHDEKEYRHAFLIVEAKKGPGGSHPRHVLCAESDEERDAWVEMLVRYFTGTYSEEPLLYGAQQSAQGQQQQTGTGGRQPPQRSLSKDEISVSKSSAVPVSQLPQDPNNAKLFSTPYSVDEINNPNYRSASPVKSMGEPSPVERAASSQSQNFPASQGQGQGQGSGQAQANLTAKRVLDRLQGLPSSLPDSSPLSGSTAGGGIDPFVQRPNSELGHYAGGGMETPDKRNLSSQSPERFRNEGRKSLYPPPSSSSSSGGTTNSANNSNSLGVTPAVAGGTNDITDLRSASPEKMDAGGGSTRVKISGPINGTPIPSGFKFKDREESASGGSDRREKVRSRFWPAWKTNGEKQIVVVPRNVFGVPLEESLDVSQICNLPSIVFRSIEYLEDKKADQEEGIYRLSGSSAVIKSLKDRFNAEGDVNLLASDEYWDPHAIAGLLKSYLRELPASILTRELHLRFLSVIDFVDPQERIKELSQLIASLPLANYTLLRALTAHLILIVQNASVNKMTMRNVGIVFSPTLGIPAGVFSLMLGEFNRVFNVDAGRDLGDDASTGEEESTNGGGEGEDMMKRNSRQYSDTAADQVLGLAGRSLKASADGTQSDADDYSVQEESGTETTGDGEMTAESVSGSGSAFTPTRDGDQFLQQQQQQQQQTTIRVSGPDTPRVSKAAHTASSKGLNVNVVSTPSRGNNRFSRVPGAGGMIGLPTSPRPPHSPSRPVDTVASSLE
ncbi:hypothetical protein P691DRAFT_702208 [Macrolepiota fuliginosa MF-IS2]|uniref:RhoGAP-domain-containing protein n=1 Tax=Macrolepiota fuliginosa MF-IS2 TaxID=1400762 RepID=A0A9P5XGR4_9AGAR|nr:hypothetical protein P691DRAFT_702208 [Macrolepiota fuliginosa MF-IS2]